MSSTRCVIFFTCIYQKLKTLLLAPRLRILKINTFKEWKGYTPDEDVLVLLRDIALVGIGEAYNKKRMAVIGTKTFVGLQRIMRGGSAVQNLNPP